MISGVLMSEYTIEAFTFAHGYLVVTVVNVNTGEAELIELTADDMRRVGKQI